MFPFALKKVLNVSLLLWQYLLGPFTSDLKFKRTWNSLSSLFAFLRRRSSSIQYFASKTLSRELKQMLEGLERADLTTSTMADCAFIVQIVWVQMKILSVMRRILISTSSSSQYTGWFVFLWKAVLSHKQKPIWSEINSTFMMKSLSHRKHRRK